VEDTAITFMQQISLLFNSWTALIGYQPFAPQYVAADLFSRRTRQFCLKQAILAPTNQQVDASNKTILELIAGISVRISILEQMVDEAGLTR
jgi:hypothetical protein